MRKQNHSQRPAGGGQALRRAAALLLSLGLMASALLAAGETPAAGTSRQFPRFELEIAAGFGLLNLSSLNLLVDSDNRYQEFSYEAYYDYLVENNLLRSWTKEAPKERHRVKTALLPSLRLKYFILDFLAVSAGFQYLRGGGSQALDFAYTRNELSDERYVETLAFAPYRLDVEAELASAGLHLSTKISRWLRAEGFLAAGLMWAACRYQSSWTYTWVIQGPNYTWTPYDSTGLLEMNGSGKGFFWEAGGRLDMPVVGRFRAFLEGGYARQTVDSISGSGRETRGLTSQTWEGPWQIQKETVTTPWGTLDLRTPSNRPREGVETESFRLDLSGFRLNLGLALAF